MRYLSPKNSLERLCEMYPERPVIDGLGELGCGSISSVVAFLGFGMGYHFFESVVNEDSSIFRAIGSGLIGLMSGGVGLLSLAVTGFVFYEGVASLSKKMGFVFEDGNVHYYNKRFFRKMSFAQRDSIGIVYPVENLDELIEKKLVLMNGVVVNSVKSDMIEDRRMIPGVCDLPDIEEIQTKYDVTLQCSFGDGSLTADIQTDDSKEDQKLCGLVGKRLYLLGFVTGSNSVRIEMYGDAFSGDK